MRINDSLRDRSAHALDEPSNIMQDLKGYPIKYNHYCTDTIKHRRETRERAAMQESVKQASSVPDGASEDGHAGSNINVDQLIVSLTRSKDADIQLFSYEEALDCLITIYKVQQKTFIANITTHVIERHIIRGLENIFPPVVVNAMCDVEVQAIASEPSSTKRQRDHIEDRITRLQDGERIFKGVLGW